MLLDTGAEVWGYDVERHPELSEDVAYDRKFHFVEGDSAQTFPGDWRHVELDFAFIDGDHTPTAALVDFRNVWKALRVGGILCAHDPLSWPAVAEVAHHICPKHIIIPTKPYPMHDRLQTGLVVAVKE